MRTMVHIEYLDKPFPEGKDVYVLSSIVNSRLYFLLTEKVQVLSISVGEVKGLDRPFMVITYQTEDENIIKRGRL